MTDPTPILGTNLASAIVPFTDADQFPTHYAQYGKGGWRSVATVEERDSIPEMRLEEGMVVYVTESQTPFIYIDGAWQELVTGSGDGGKQTFKRLSYTKNIESLPPEGIANFTLPFGKTSMILRLTVSRPVKVIVYSTPDYTDTNPYTFLATSDHLTDDGSALLSDGTILKQRNYSIFANLETPAQEQVYAVVESVDSADGPVSIDFLYIIIESGVPSNGGEFGGLNVLLNSTPYDSGIDSIDFTGSNWELQNSTNGLPLGTLGLSVAGSSVTKYIIPMNFTYGPLANEVLLMHTFVETVSFDENFLGSAGNVEINPSDTFVMNVYKNLNVVGSITVSSNGVITFTAPEMITFSPGDVIKVKAPSVVDNFITNLAVSFLGTRAP